MLDSRFMTRSCSDKRRWASRVERRLVRSPRSSYAFVDQSNALNNLDAACIGR